MSALLERLLSWISAPRFENQKLNDITHDIIHAEGVLSVFEGEFNQRNIINQF